MRQRRLLGWWKLLESRQGVRTEEADGVERGMDLGWGKKMIERGDLEK